MKTITDFKYWLRGYLFEKLKNKEYNFDIIIEDISKQSEELIENNNNIIVKKLENIKWN